MTVSEQTVEAAENLLRDPDYEFCYQVKEPGRGQSILYTDTILDFAKQDARARAGRDPGTVYAVYRLQGCSRVPVVAYCGKVVDSSLAPLNRVEVEEVLTPIGSEKTGPGDPLMAHDVWVQTYIHGRVYKWETYRDGQVDRWGWMARELGSDGPYDVTDEVAGEVIGEVEQPRGSGEQFVADHINRLNGRL